MDLLNTSTNEPFVEKQLTETDSSTNKAEINEDSINNCVSASNSIILKTSELDSLPEKAETTSNKTEDTCNADNTGDKNSHTSSDLPLLHKEHELCNSDEKLINPENCAGSISEPLQSSKPEEISQTEIKESPVCIENKISDSIIGNLVKISEDSKTENSVQSDIKILPKDCDITQPVVKESAIESDAKTDENCIATTESSVKDDESVNSTATSAVVVQEPNKSSDVDIVKKDIEFNSDITVVSSTSSPNKPVENEISNNENLMQIDENIELLIQTNEDSKKTDITINEFDIGIQHKDEIDSAEIDSITKDSEITTNTVSDSDASTDKESLIPNNQCDDTIVVNDGEKVVDNDEFSSVSAINDNADACADLKEKSAEILEIPTECSTESHISDEKQLQTCKELEKLEQLQIEVNAFDIDKTNESTETEEIEKEVVIEKIVEKQTEIEKINDNQVELEKLTEEQTETEIITAKQFETEKIVDKQTEAEETIKKQSETEKVIEKQTEAEELTELQTETEKITELQTETEKVTELQAETEKITELQAETEKITEIQAETEKITEKAVETEEITETDTIIIDKQIATDQIIEAPSETEKITEEQLPIENINLETKEIQTNATSNEKQNKETPMIIEKTTVKPKTDQANDTLEKTESLSDTPNEKETSMEIDLADQSDNLNLEDKVKDNKMGDSEIEEIILPEKKSTGTVSVELDAVEKQTNVTAVNSDKPSDNKTISSEQNKTTEISLIDDDLEIISVTDNASEKEKSKNDQNSDEDLEIISVDKQKNTVIEIDDNDKRRKRRKRKKVKENQCINYSCTSGGIDLKPATGYCLSFFKVKSNSNKTNLVCKACRDFCLENMSTMIDMLINSEPIVNFHIPVKSDCVEIIDSDEEDKRETEQFSETEVATLNLEIDLVLSDTLDKCNLDLQFKKAEEFIDAKAKSNENSFVELDSMLNKLQLQVDTLRSKLYEDRPRNEEFPAIEIIDVADMPFTVSAAPKEAERRSLRRISKPITYDESVLLEESPPETPLHQARIVQPISAPNSHEQEVIAVGIATPLQVDLPPRGTVIREPPKLNEIYHAMKSNMFGAWFKCKVIEIHPTGTKITDNDIIKYCEVPYYKVRFEGAKYKHITKTITGKQLAYSTPCSVRLPIGSRVIALFKDGDNHTRKDLFTGIVAEPMTSINDFRYLIFFDDGYAQYVSHNNVYLLVEANPNVWEDVPPESQEYIKSYLKEYPERPMVRLTKGQVIRTEWNGKWWTARVLQVDGSLVLMYFDADARSEWIYRGSKRLAPLFNNSQQSKMRLSRGLIMPSRSTLRPQLKGPYVEYTRYSPDTDIANYNQQVARAVARKSTTVVQSPRTMVQNSIVPFLPSAVSQPASKVIYYTPRAGTQPALYRPHQCGPNCMKLAKRKLNELKQYSMLAKPILAGWFRACVRYAKNKREIRYVTPCSRTIRNMQELHLYLRITQCEMSVDMFDFDFWVHILAEFSVEKYYASNKDLSEGSENIPIQCLNYIDGTMPDYCRYTSKREPMKGVNLNLNPEFLCGCDCVDDCQDKSKCACWQLTIQGTVFGKNKTPDMSVGYVYKRLPEPVVTGIYECNSRCKCASTCLNRVVQHPLQQKLQVFKTANRGWGIRCLNDIPQGSFICIYAGHLLTEQMANEGGKSNGDEYLAELDYIEVVERLKEGYESDVHEDADSKTDEDKTSEDDEDENEDERLKREQDREDKDFICPIPTGNTGDSPIKTRSKRKKNTDESQTSDSDKSESAQNTENASKTNTETGDTNNSKSTGESKETNKEEDSKTNSGEEECVTISDDEDTVRERVGFIPSINADDKDSDEPKNKSVRAMFGESETCYVMDAKNAGNIGRFLNHSCNPNVFVQNVFVDTHDLRFPWVAFFALVYVRAGTELTWNYNYDVGSVPGKVLYCHCGQPECRGRLL